MTRFHSFVFAFAFALLALGATAHSDESGLPAGSVQLSPCVPGMGEHWANPDDMPFGPIYGVKDGRLVFVEVMISQEDFNSGKSWTDVLHPAQDYAIDHLDIEFGSQGHEGYEIPHYDLHAYFVSHETHTAFCPPS